MEEMGVRVKLSKASVSDDTQIEYEPAGRKDEQEWLIRKLRSAPDSRRRRRWLGA
jgi:hypothetical protein